MVCVFPNVHSGDDDAYDNDAYDEDDDTDDDNHLFQTRTTLSL